MNDNEIAAAVLTAVAHYDYHTASKLIEEASSPEIVALLLAIVAAGAIRSSGISLELALPVVCLNLTHPLPETTV